MGWLPEWAAKDYAKLFMSFRKKPFDFDSCRDVLQTTEHETSRIIQELENEGFLFKRRKSTDRRKRLYYLISPEQAVHALSFVQSKLVTLEEKLRAVSGSVPYVVTGSAAAYKYHRFMSTRRTDISVFKRDIGFWVALVKKPNLQVAINGHAAERGEVLISLFTNLTETAASGAVEIDGINYEPCDEVVANSIRDGTDTAVLDASAILIVSMEDLNWELLAESYVRQEVGFIMEVINYVAGNVVFNDHIVDKFRKDNGLRKSFGSRVLSVQDSQGFLALADKWDLDLRVPPRILKKVVLDLIG